MSILAPRLRKPSTKLPTYWWALYNSQGIIVTYIRRSTESAARDEVSDPLCFGPHGTVKKVVKPPLGWINGRIKLLTGKRRSQDRAMEKEITILKGLL